MPSTASSALAIALASLTEVSAAGAGSIFRSSPFCVRRNCINPIFPGFEDLHRLSEATWQCASLPQVVPSTSFCRAAVTYDPAVLAPEFPGEPNVTASVRRQDRAATTMFTYHLAGMGMDAWDFPKPEESDDDCVKAIWRMVCYTYFPQARPDCPDGAGVPFTRPCQSSCQNYIRACGVECCDAEVQCVSARTRGSGFAVDSALVTESEVAGYHPSDGPSSSCTGGAARSQAPGVFLYALGLACILWCIDGALREFRQVLRRVSLLKTLWSVTMLGAVFLVQGCHSGAPARPAVVHWRTEPNYLVAHSYLPPESVAEEALLNSCALQRAPQAQQCSGHGVCDPWDRDAPQGSATFCRCSRDWADPECRTPRRSQAVAYLLSVFLGPLGADLFYLGFYGRALLKLLTLGGLGLWWLFDIVRIGSAPVYASQFRTAADLPHSVFVLSTITLALLVGFATAHAIVRSRGARPHKDLPVSEDGPKQQVARPLPGGAAAAPPSYGALGAGIPAAAAPAGMSNDPSPPPTNPLLNLPVLNPGARPARWENNPTPPQSTRIIPAATAPPSPTSPLLHLGHGYTTSSPCSANGVRYQEATMISVAVEPVSSQLGYVGQAPPPEPRIAPPREAMATASFGEPSMGISNGNWGPPTNEQIMVAASRPSGPAAAPGRSPVAVMGE